MIICPNCSFNNINSANYCQECGKKFPVNVSQTNKTEIEVKFSNVNFDHDFLSLIEPHFFGQFHRSENGKYIIGWNDYDPASEIGGYRESGYGCFMLIEENKIILKGQIQRPNDGKVANNGNFVIADWLFGGDLNGIFYTFNKEGKFIIQQKVNANILNTSISPSGNYAIFQTANNNEDGDGNKLFLFKLNPVKLFWKLSPPFWATNYFFDEESNILKLEHDHQERYKFSFKGEFLDQEKYYTNRLKLATGYELLTITKEKYVDLQNQNATSEKYLEIIPLFQKVVKSNISDYTKAQAYRMMGEVYLNNKDKNAAIQSFENALTYNPNVGIKRLYEKLKKENDK